MLSRINNDKHTCFILLCGKIYSVKQMKKKYFILQIIHGWLAQWYVCNLAYRFCSERERERETERHTHTHTQIYCTIINIFTDGSKIGRNVGAAAVIIKDDIVLHQSKFKLHKKCSNNQAKQVAILRSLEKIQNLPLTEDAEKTAVVNTDSKVILDALQNRHKHYILIENIRNEIKRLEDLWWTVFFNWVKAHVGIQGNEMADRLAKKAVTEDRGNTVW